MVNKWSSSSFKVRGRNGDVRVSYRGSGIVRLIWFAFFSTGCPEHPWHVWGTDARFVHSWYRVPFCELEGKDYVAFFISLLQIRFFSFSISFHLCLGKLFVFARKKIMLSIFLFYKHTHMHRYEIKWYPGPPI